MPKWNTSTLNMLRYVLSGTTRCTLVLLTLLEGAGKTRCLSEGGAPFA